MEEPGRPVPVTLRFRALRVDRVPLQRLLRRCLDAEEAPSGFGIGLILAGGRLLRQLNREWRGRDATTDVLSFPYDEAPPLPAEAGAGSVLAEARLLGEIVISIPRCREQAATQGVDPGVELVRLAVHGALHVLGYDHELPLERAAMERRERSLRRWARGAGLGPGVITESRARKRPPRRRGR